MTPRAELSSRVVLTASVLPSAFSATKNPKLSYASVLEALMYACCAHGLPEPARVKTYTAPESLAESSFWLPLTPFASLSSSGALTASVLPSRLTASVRPDNALPKPT